jgi:hypothetical protein
MKQTLPRTVPLSVCDTRCFAFMMPKSRIFTSPRSEMITFAGRDVAVDQPHRAAGVVALVVRVGEAGQHLVGQMEDRVVRQHGFAALVRRR